MTKEETRELMGMIRDNFHGFYSGVPAERMRRYVDLWAAQLADIPYRDALGGFARYLRENKYPPTLAEIRAEALRGTCGAIPPHMLRRTRNVLDRFFSAHPERLPSGQRAPADGDPARGALPVRGDGAVPPPAENAGNAENTEHTAHTAAGEVM